VKSSETLAVLLQRNSSTLFMRYAHIKEMAATGFQPYATMVGYLTDHGPQHYANIEANLDLMLSEEMKQALAPEEIFLLLCGVHFHDIGLLSERYSGEAWTDVRKEHVERTYDYLDEHYEDWGFNRFEAFALKHICLGHGGKTLYDLPKTEVIHRTTVRIQFLSALLRMADELDLDYTRTSKYIRQLKKIPEDSLKHWIKHEEVGGVYINPKSWTIQVHAMPETLESKTLIQEMVVQKAQKELDYVRPIFEENGLYYRQIDISYTDFGEKQIKS
jgi:hypothetical protein